MLYKFNYSKKKRSSFKQCDAILCLIFLLAIVLPWDVSSASSDNWNFTRRDLVTLYNKGQRLQFHSDSNWLPVVLRNNILSTIEFTLSPENTFATAKGVNITDFFHGHVGCRRPQILPPETSILSVLEEFGYSWSYLTINREFRKRFGTDAFSVKPGQKNIAEYTAAVLATEKQLSFGMQENILRCRDLSIIYHTNEFELGQGLSDPRRNVITDQADLKPRHFTPMTANASSWMLEYEPMLNVAFLVDHGGVIHVTYGFVSELSRVVGKPVVEPSFIRTKPKTSLSIENFWSWLR